MCKWVNRQFQQTNNFECNASTVTQLYVWILRSGLANFVIKLEPFKATSGRSAWSLFFSPTENDSTAYFRNIAKVCSYLHWVQILIIISRSYLNCSYCQQEDNVSHKHSCCSYHSALSKFLNSVSGLLTPVGGGRRRWTR